MTQLNRKSDRRVSTFFAISLIASLSSPPVIPQTRELTARLKVEVRDRSSGRTMPARIYLHDPEGKTHVPPGAISYQRRMEHHFVTRGSFEIDLLPGRYILSAERGPEFRGVSREFSLAAGESRSESVSLERWIDMNARGWYSGDLHNHRKLEEMPDLLLAEDLNFAPTLTDWIWEDRATSTPPAASAPVRQVDSTHAFTTIDKEVERLEAGPGAVGLIGLKSVIPFDGYRLYPPNSRYCEMARAQGGYVDAEKITWRDVAALVALGHVDFAGIVHNHFNRHDVELETDRWGMIPKSRPEFNTAAGMPLWAMEVYYGFLNCGFRLPVSAGSASGVKASPLGYSRAYVKLNARFDHSTWLASLKRGRSFATNGPMLFLTADGREPGAILRIPSKGPARIRIRAEAASRGDLDRLEIVHNGRVVRAVSKSGAKGGLKADFVLPVEESGWLAARCFEIPGTTIRFAHTSPVYLEGLRPNSSTARSAEFFIRWLDREIDFYRGLSGFRDPAHREEVVEFFSKARAVYERLSKGTPDR